eukprot:TRINITY_DN56310_c0_g1_i1.p1 TRINITY_DN56310_c0_g1~~TRINITY_DN56310_c0_g1_i1.p1  ORF type:complete len:109 (+),score=30.40 TRINITY_DN56310_c0_g1_i1:80-406(+)
MTAAKSSLEPTKAEKEVEAKITVAERLVLLFLVVVMCLPLIGLFWMPPWLEEMIGQAESAFFDEARDPEAFHNQGLSTEDLMQGHALDDGAVNVDAEVVSKAHATSEL